MTEQDRVTVNDPRGAVNTGDGPQYVFHGVGADWMIRKGVESLRIVREDRERLADRFVRPPGYRAAAERLEKPGAVVPLKGLPGSGRRAAAVMLLHELAEPTAVDREVRFDELLATEQDEAPFTPGEGDRFLLDLSGLTDEETYARARQRLAVRRSQVEAAGAHMVAVLPWDMEHVHTPDLGTETVTLERPRGLTVLTRHLRMERLAFTPADLGDASLREVCDRSPMRELARLARLVKDARDSGRYGTDFAGWLGQATQAVTDRAEEVRRQVSAVGTTPERALLLATAVFEEARWDTVYEAWLCLLRTVKHEEEAVTELARTAFGERLTDLGIEPDPEGRLRFRRLAYADAVRTYFWANFPGARDDFRDWIGETAGLRGVTTDDRLNVAVGFGEQTLAVGRPDHLFDLVARWADGATGTSCDRGAVVALELGLRHEKLGTWFRRRVYDCTRSGTLSDGLVRVLTTVCRQSLAVTHPEQALVRLHHLAVRRGKAAHEARVALFDLVGGDRGLFHLLIDRLRARAGHQSHRSAVHLDLLTDLLRSDRAPDPPSWPDLFRGWETVFSHPPAALWKPLVDSWLTSVVNDPAQEAALGTLVDAAHGRTAALHRLYAIACDWAGTTRLPSRAAVAARFWQHIDDAQYARKETTGRTGAGSSTTEEAR
ncbi:hypothetical protein ACFWNK_24735 [Streptomyces sp. NPDC058417]|uniref:hypothetical protein n=1 Tax=unclassified Streptomyces TaxID=2593676 RepID=UPI0036469295